MQKLFDCPPGDSDMSLEALESGKLFLFFHSVLLLNKLKINKTIVYPLTLKMTILGAILQIFKLQCHSVCP